MLMNSSVTMTARSRLGQQANAMLALLWLRTKQIYKVVRNRRAITRLLEQDDHLLADIGLTRQDVRNAIVQSIWRDPTVILGGRASVARRETLRSDGRR